MRRSGSVLGVGWLVTEEEEGNRGGLHRATVICSTSDSSERRKQKKILYNLLMGEITGKGSFTLTK